MTIFTVTNTNDSGAGSLRQAINDANAAGAPSGVPGAANVVVFADGVTGTIALQSALPLIYSNMTIEGGPGVVIDGGGAHRAFFVSGVATTGNGAPPEIVVSISDFVIQNVVAQGGHGSGSGGGGLGAGGGLFVNQNAHVTIDNVSFDGAQALGGERAGGGVGGGGGGLGGNGGRSSMAAAGVSSLPAATGSAAAAVGAAGSVVPVGEIYWTELAAAGSEALAAAAVVASGARVGVSALGPAPSPVAPAGSAAAAAAREALEASVAAADSAAVAAVAASRDTADSAVAAVAASSSGETADSAAAGVAPKTWAGAEALGEVSGPLSRAVVAEPVVVVAGRWAAPSSSWPAARSPSTAMAPPRAGHSRLASVAPAPATVKPSAPAFSCRRPPSSSATATIRSATTSPTRMAPAAPPF